MIELEHRRLEYVPQCVILVEAQPGADLVYLAPKGKRELVFQIVASHILSEGKIELWKEFAGIFIVGAGEERSTLHIVEDGKVGECDFVDPEVLLQKYGKQYHKKGTK